jgi:hypothetical protein
VERLPPPHRHFPVGASFHTCSVGVRLWRIYFRRGKYPSSWNDFRHFGPTSSRFDHQTLPKRLQARGILYATHGSNAVLTALAEVFQETRHIDRKRNDPWLAAFDLAVPVKLLDLSGTWPIRAGGNMAINSGGRGRAREWSRKIYSSYTDADGLWYPSSLVNRPAVALYERAARAMPGAPVFNRPLTSPALANGLLKYADQLSYTLL